MSATLPRSVSLAGTLVLAGALVLAVAGAVSAHAELVSSDPAEGDVVAGVEMLFVANYDEALTTDGSSTLIVSDAAGNQVASGTTNPNDHQQLTAPLAALAPGAYVARWTAVTADDLGIARGEINFSVASGLTPTPSPSPPPAPTGGLPIEWIVVLAVVIMGVGLVGYLLRRSRTPSG